jgi:hypothetical protein
LRSIRLESSVIYAEEKSTTVVIATSLGKNCKQITSKAKYLGLRLRPSNFRWSEEELELLETLAETMPLVELVKKYQRIAKRKGWHFRTFRAIEKKILELGYSLIPQVGCYTVPALASALGFSESKVKSWIIAKLLIARQDGGDRGRYSIFAKDLKKFAYDYPSKITSGLSEEGMRWLLQALADAK